MGYDVDPHGPAYLNFEMLLNKSGNARLSIGK